MTNPTETNSILARFAAVAERLKGTGAFLESIADAVGGGE